MTDLNDLNKIKKLYTLLNYLRISKRQRRFLAALKEIECCLIEAQFERDEREFNNGGGDVK